MKIKKKWKNYWNPILLIKNKEFQRSARFTLVLTLAFILFGLTAYSQEQTYTVTGRIIDVRGDGVIGVNVIIPGSNIGAGGDLEGVYTLSNVKMNDVIEFSALGFKTERVVFTGQTEINLTLEDDAQMLGESVVIGYGSSTRRELSSSIVQIGRKDFQQGAMSNPMELITGKVAGLNVVNSAAANPNSGSDLQIRGATSVYASNSPLVVIDGIIGGNIRTLSSQDIESITVLKDAASAAIYGTRGANGVILVTTRKGSGGEAGTYRINYDSWFGINVAKPKPDILSPDEFRRSLRGTDYGASTVWYDELMRDFSYDNNQYISIDGNTQNGTYGASLNYRQATGLDIASARKEYGARFTLSQRALENYVEINASLNARKVHEDWGEDGMFDTALNMNPTMPVYNADGSYYQPTSPVEAKNPVSQLKLNTSEGDRLYVLGTVEAKLHLLRTSKHTLNTSVSYSMHYDDLKQGYYTPSDSGESYWFGYKGRARAEYQKWWQNQYEWLVNYGFSSTDHNVRVVAGYSYREEHYESLGNENYDFAYDSFLWNNMGAGSYLKEGQANMWSGKSLAKLIGVFGRINYNWKNLLIASVALRYEGSTKFGPDNRWGAFPSASLAWEISNMEFMEDVKPMFNSLKPRVSYGVTGRSDFGTNMSMPTYGINRSYLIDGEWVVGYSSARNANRLLGWEKLQSINIGLDFALWDRVRGSFDWYNRQSKDLLNNYRAPQPPYIHNTILVNVGTTENTGFEIALQGDVLKNTPVRWSTGINYSYSTTKLKKMSNDIYTASYFEMYGKPGVGTTEFFFRLEEGSKVGQFYGYRHAGVSETGHLLVYTNDGEKVPVSEADPSYKSYIGNGAPTTYLSWDNTIEYKNFYLNIFARGAFGFDIFNMRRYGMGLIRSGTDNVLRDAYTKYADITQDGGGVISSFFLENGNYFKIENITLGYNVPLKSRRFVDNLRVYFSVKNVVTFTGYSGNDPSIVGINGLTPGVDINSAYPLATQFSIGVNLQFK